MPATVKRVSLLGVPMVGNFLISLGISFRDIAEKVPWDGCNHTFLGGSQPSGSLAFSLFVFSGGFHLTHHKLATFGGGSEGSPDLKTLFVAPWVSPQIPHQNGYRKCTRLEGVAVLLHGLRQRNHLCLRIGDPWRLKGTRKGANQFG